MQRIIKEFSGMGAVVLLILKMEWNLSEPDAVNSFKGIQTTKDVTRISSDTTDTVDWHHAY